MKRLLILFCVISAVCLAQTVPLTVGVTAPDPGTCNKITSGSLYVRSGDPTNAPIGVYRCSQVGPVQVIWQPIDHLVLATLPTTCTVGDIGYQTSGTTGLYACTAANTWGALGGLSAVTVQSNGTVVGSRGTINIVPGSGIVPTVSDTGTKINIQSALDTTVAETRLNEAAGADLLVTPASGSGTAYVGCPVGVTPPLTTGMVVHLVPDVSSTGGATTFNYCGTGPIALTEADGVTNLAASDLVLGRQQDVWYDGAIWRKKNPISGAPAVWPSFGTAALVNTGTSGGTVPLLNGTNTWSGTQGGTVFQANGTAATDSASLGSELTTSGTCSGTGWTGTYPNYIAPATTAPLTCTGFANGSYYQTVSTITNNAGVTAATYTSGVSATGSGTCLLAFTGGGGSGATASIAVTSNVPGAITITAPGTGYTGTPTGASVSNGTLTCTGTAVLTSTIGGGTVTVGLGTTQTAVTSSAASSTTTAGLKSAATSLTYTPTAAFVGTLNVSAKLITPISVTRLLTTDSTGAASVGISSSLASLHNLFIGGGGGYNTTGNSNSCTGLSCLYFNTTGTYNFGGGYQAGRYISGGSTANQTSLNSTYLGANTMALASGDTDETVIGYNATGAGSHTVVMGASTVTDVYDGSATPTATHHALAYESDGTTFTIASGCGSPGSLVGGGTAGSFTAGQTACAPVLTFSHTAPHGWSCYASDITHPTDYMPQSAYTATSCTVTGTVSSSDTIVFHAIAF